MLIALGQGCCFITGRAATILADREREGGKATRTLEERHGAPNREPPKRRPCQTPQSLRPVRRDDLPAGMVRVLGATPRTPSLGVRGVRLQVRDPGLVRGRRREFCALTSPPLPRGARIGGAHRRKKRATGMAGGSSCG